MTPDNNNNNKNYPFDPVKMGMIYERVNDIHSDMKDLCTKVDKQNSRVSKCEVELERKVNETQFNNLCNKVWKLYIILAGAIGGAEALKLWMR